MNRIRVHASRDYEVQIGPGLLETLGAQTVFVSSAKKAAIVSDSNVWPLYGARAMESLRKAGLESVSFVFPAGEERKNSTIYLQILNFLAENHLTRSDVVLALGGGVVGDITGFSAATYLRGIDYIQIPTTLLAAVDSSVGGKTAIDLPAGKNLCGAFWQPKLVLCDTDTLSSLPENIFRDGCAEVIKYGVLYSPALFAALEQDGLAFDREAVISQCVRLKRDVVAEDEFDTGARQKLNLGHTVGHALELLSHYSLSHGQAVATGMAIVARCCGCADADRIGALLKKFGFSLHAPYAPNAIVQGILSDKKRAANTVSFIFPRGIGDCITVPIPISDLESFLRAGL